MNFAMRWLVAVYLAGIFIMCISGCSGCHGTSNPPPTKSPGPSAPELSKEFDGKFSGDTNFSISLANERTWTVKVKSGKVSSKDGRQVLTLEGLESHLYEQGREVLQVSADKGQAVRDGDVLTTEFSGHVRAIENKLNQQLYADIYRWVSTEKVMHVKKFRLVGEKATLSADEGTISLDMTEANFKGHVLMNITGR